VWLLPRINCDKVLGAKLVSEKNSMRCLKMKSDYNIRQDNAGKFEIETGGCTSKIVSFFCFWILIATLLYVA